MQAPPSDQAVGTEEAPANEVKGHNQLLNEFHVSLMQDPLFVEVLQATGGQAAGGENKILDFMKLALAGSEQLTTMKQSEEDWEAALENPVDVPALEGCVMAASTEALDAAIGSMGLLLGACASALRTSQPAKVCRALQVLCIVLRGMQWKSVSFLSFLKAVGGESRGEQYTRMVVGDITRVLTNEVKSAFCITLALKFLNVLVTAAHGGPFGTKVGQWLKEGGVIAALKTAVGKSRRFRHCLSLDAVVLTVVVGLSAPASPAPTKDPLEDPEDMKAMLEATDVLCNVAVQRLLEATHRKTLAVEGFLTNKKIVPHDAKDLKTLLSADGGPIHGSQLCYVAACCLALYYLGVYHTRPYLLAFQARKKQKDGAPEPEPAGRELAPDGFDGMPTVFASSVTLLSLLLDAPQADTVHYAKLVLLSILPLVEDQEFLPTICVPKLGGYSIFSRKAEPDQFGLFLKVEENRAPLAVLMQILLNFMSSNLKLALEVDLYSVVLRIVHRILCYYKNCTAGEEMAFDWKDLVMVTLRLVAYLSREAVWKAAEPAAINDLALQAAAILNLFLVHGNSILQGPEGYPLVCYELGRVGANKVFKKLLDLSSAEGNASPLQEELRQLMSAADHINAVVESWLNETKPLSPTREDVLAVVASAQLSLSLPNRQDLLNFENFVEDNASSTLARGRGDVLVALFCKFIHVFPPRPEQQQQQQAAPAKS